MRVNGCIKAGAQVFNKQSGNSSKPDEYLFFIEIALCNYKNCKIQ